MLCASIEQTFAHRHRLSPWRAGAHHVKDGVYMHGTLALVGSGEYLPPMEPVDRQLLQTVPANPRVVCLPTAAGTEGPERIAYWSDLGVNHFRRLGADALAVPVIDRQLSGGSRLRRPHPHGEFRLPVRRQAQLPLRYAGQKPHLGSHPGCHGSRRSRGGLQRRGHDLGVALGAVGPAARLQYVAWGRHHAPL